MPKTVTVPRQNADGATFDLDHGMAKPMRLAADRSSAAVAEGGPVVGDVRTFGDEDPAVVIGDLVGSAA